MRKFCVLRAILESTILNVNFFLKSMILIEKVFVKSMILNEIFCVLSDFELNFFHLVGFEIKFLQHTTF